MFQVGKRYSWTGKFQGTKITYYGILMSINHVKSTGLVQDMFGEVWSVPLSEMMEVK